MTPFLKAQQDIAALQEKVAALEADMRLVREALLDIATAPQEAPAQDPSLVDEGE